MSLATEAQARLPSALLLQLTNQSDTTATSVDTTILGYAATDAAAEFEQEVGVAFDSTVASHVAAGIAGVLYYLYLYTGKSGAAVEGAETRWRQRLKSLATTLGSAAPVYPVTTALTDQVLDADRDAWDSYTLDNPRRRDGDDDLAENRRSG